jgi:hypothetical protein
MICVQGSLQRHCLKNPNKRMAAPKSSAKIAHTRAQFNAASFSESPSNSLQSPSPPSNVPNLNLNNPSVPPPLVTSKSSQLEMTRMLKITDEHQNELLVDHHRCFEAAYKIETIGKTTRTISKTDLSGVVWAFHAALAPLLATVERVSFVRRTRCFEAAFYRLRTALLLPVLLLLLHP